LHSNYKNININLYRMNMELLENDTQPQYKLQFFGKGSEFFGIMIVNWLLTLITLGIYYPWARAKTLKYVFGSTALNDDRFHFSGTGQEMFIGFLKVIVFLVVFYLLLFSFSLAGPYALIGALLMYLLLFLFIPLAIHGSMRYRMSRTSLRGVRFGYRGSKKELFGKFLPGIFLTIITLGIYGAWFEINLRKYICGNVRYGDVKCHYEANGMDFFVLNLVGGLLTLVTLGIYSFWYQKKLFAYYVDNTFFTKDDRRIELRSTATAGGFFKLLVGNFFLVVFTLGLGAAWADMRTQQFIIDNIKLEGDIDLNAVQQTEDEYHNAFGEDAIDFFDIDLT